MFRRQIKNIILFVLVAIFLYQTVRLWFGDSSSRNFFYSFFYGRESYNNDTSEYVYMEPSSIFISTGNKSFYVRYKNEFTEELFKSLNESVSQTLRTGSFVFEKTIDWDELLSRKAFILHFGFLVPTDEFIKNFANTGFTQLNRLKNISSIMVMPSRSQFEDFQIAFLDEEANNCVLFKDSQGKNNLALNSYIDSISETGQLFFIASTQSGFSMFNKNLFIPQWSGNDLHYNEIEMIDPFSEDSDMYAFIDNFFENPAARWQGQVDGIPTFSDENRVVKYYPDGFLEYANYDSYDSNSGSLESAYITALNFMNKNSALGNDVFLTSSKQYEDGFVFCFDYTFDNYPIFFSKEILSKYNLSSAIEITVQGNKVYKYRRFIKQFREKRTKEQPLLSEDFTKILENFISREMTPKESFFNKIEDVALGYHISKDNIKMEWFLRYNNKWSSFEALDANFFTDREGNLDLDLNLNLDNNLISFLLAWSNNFNLGCEFNELGTRENHSDNLLFVTKFSSAVP